MVLGGLVAGPALAVGGFVMAGQSKKKLNAAKDNLSEAKIAAKQMHSVEIQLDYIQSRAQNLRKLLNKGNQELVSLVRSMKSIIQETGTDWRAFRTDQKETIHKATLLAQMLKGVIDTTLLDDNGELTDESNAILEEGEKFITQVQKVKMAQS